jgi:small subunit ribosomal protein S16
MLKIRLLRTGAKKQPSYRIVVANSRSPRDGRFIERVGIYMPLLKKDDANRTKLNEERIRYWLSKGAQPTDRIARILGNASILPKPTFTHGVGKAKKKAEEAQKAAAEAAAKAEGGAPAQA